MTHQCQQLVTIEAQCPRDAVVAVKINVPAKGYVIGQHQHFTLVVGLTLCDRHYRDLRIADLLTDTLRQVCEIATRGKAPPDYDRAWLSRVTLTSSEFLMLQKQPKSVA